MKLLNNTQSKRSILSKCGVDKQIFLSDVYKKRTQAKKHQLDVPQFGRSMVEMLGVLAIIGVLSVGSIAGYSKAMQKHKINTTLDKLSHVIARIVELKESGSLGDDAIYPEIISKSGFECDYDEDLMACKLPIGNYRLEATKYSGNLVIEFDKNSGIENAVELCTAFFTTGLHLTVPEDWWTNQHAYTSTSYPGKYAYLYSKEPMYIEEGAKSEITASDIANACALCENQENLSNIGWVMWDGQY